MSDNWSVNTYTPPQQINGNKKYKKNDALSLQAINAIVENAFYAANNVPQYALGIVILSTSSGTMTDVEFTKVTTNNFLISYDNSLYVKTYDDATNYYFYSNKEDNTTSSGSQVITKYYISINKTTKVYSCTTIDFINVYNKSQTDALFGNYVQKTTTIAGVDLQDNVTKNELLVALNVGDGAEANVQADWNQTDTTADDYIKNKPTIPTDTNQKIKTSSVTFGADDVVEIEAGSNVSITGDATNKKITISATGGTQITVDSTLSTTSENPVQNKVITNALNSKIGIIELEDETGTLTNEEYTNALNGYLLRLGGLTFINNDYYDNEDTTVEFYIADIETESKSSGEYTGLFNYKIVVTKSTKTYELVKSNIIDVYNRTQTLSLLQNVVHKTNNEDIYGLKTFDQRPKVGIEQELPSAYQKLEYIESTNGQYIDTGYTDETIKKAQIKLSFSSVSGTQYVLGAISRRTINYAAKDCGRVFVRLANGVIGYRTRYSSSYDVNTSISAQVDTIYDIETTLNNGSQSMTVKGLETITSSNQIYDALTNVYLFKTNGADSAQNGLIKLYECKLYNGNNELVRHYVPCKRISDDYIGVYDFVSETFSYSGSTAFVAGPVVNPTDDTFVMLKGDIEANPTLVGTESNLNSITIKGTDFKIPQAPVSSVNGQTGSVVLDADDISDSSTTNKFVTASEKSQITTNASNITNLQTSKQNALTTSSVSDGTLDKAVGFDSQGNLIKGTVSGGGGTTVIANPTLDGTESDLTGIQVGNVKYKVPTGGGGGGSGITNYEVIDRPNSLPTATATSPDFVQYNGKLYRKQISGGVPSVITDLTGTSWEFNSNITATASYGQFNIIAEDNETTGLDTLYIGYIFNPIQIQPQANSIVWMPYITPPEGIFTITGGTDATNSNLISWLQENATMTPIDVYSYELVSNEKGSLSLDFYNGSSANRINCGTTPTTIATGQITTNGGAILINLSSYFKTINPMIYFYYYIDGNAEEFDRFDFNNTSVYCMSGTKIKSLSAGTHTIDIKVVGLLNNAAIELQPYNTTYINIIEI